MKKKEFIIISLFFIVLNLSFIFSLSPTQEYTCCQMLINKNPYYEKQCLQFNLTKEKCQPIFDKMEGVLENWEENNQEVKEDMNKKEKNINREIKILEIGDYVKIMGKEDYKIYSIITTIIIVILGIIITLLFKKLRK